MLLRQIVYLSLVALSSIVWAADETDTSIETISDGQSHSRQRRNAGASPVSTFYGGCCGC